MKFHTKFELQFKIHITQSFKYSTMMHISPSIITVAENSIGCLLFALTVTRIVWKTLEIWMNRVGVANASIIRAYYMVYNNNYNSALEYVFAFFFDVCIMFLKYHTIVA